MSRARPERRWPPGAAESKPHCTWHAALAANSLVPRSLGTAHGQAPDLRAGSPPGPRLVAGSQLTSWILWSVGEAGPSL